MKYGKKLQKLDELTLETDMLVCILDDALKQHEHKIGITPISYLTELIRNKFKNIRAVF